MKNIARTLLFVAAVSLSTMPSYAHISGCDPHPQASQSWVDSVLSFFGI